MAWAFTVFDGGVRKIARYQQVFAIREVLAQRDFYRGEPDGTLGSETKKALRSYQAAAGLPADGFASSGVLARLAASSMVAKARSYSACEPSHQ